MIKFFSNIPIFRRLFIAFAVAAVIPGIVIILLGNFYINSLTNQGQAVATSFDAQSVAAQQQANLQRMNALLQTDFNQVFASLSNVVKDSSLYASGGLNDKELHYLEAQFQQTLTTYVGKYELATSDNMANVRTILLNDDPTNGNNIINTQKTALDNTIGYWKKYKQSQDALLNTLNTLQQDVLNGNIPSQAQINADYNRVYPTMWQANYDFTNLKNSWQDVVDTASNMGKSVTAVGASQTQPVIIATAAAFVMTILVVIATGWLVNITITQPLRRLASLTRRIAKGDTRARATIASHDEIGRVAEAMNNMLDNIVHLIQEAQTQRDALQAQVEKLVSEVSGVGEGDLRVQAEVTADALGVLADSFNYMVEELGSLVVRVKMVAHEVENSTTMTFERMSQLVESANMQINQIGQAAIEIERMAESSRQVAERAQILYSIAREARQTAQGGRASVLQTIEGMGRINNYVQETSNKVQALSESSREINNIVEVISNIAHQTNRLALDAAIQAAMAGENGKGFGAVAADIRRLAERAKEQAGSIARIVRSVREDIGAAAVSMRDTERETASGARLAQEAGSSLESIFSVIERQGREIETINQMAKQQEQSSSIVVQIMQAVSNATQQSSSSTREAAQNMERLARLAEQLLASVEAFKLRDNLNYYAPTNVTVTPEAEPEGMLSVSGYFRTVTAGNAYPANGGNAYLPPGPSQYPPYAPLPSPQNGYGNGNGTNGRSSHPQWQ